MADTLLKLLAALGLALLALGPHAQAVTHVVKKGETLTEIADAYDVTLSALKKANNIDNANKIRVGQKLNVPAPTPRFVHYKIKTGDSLSRVAQNHGITLEQLSRANGIKNADKIRVGQVVKIPLPDTPEHAEQHFSDLKSSVLRELNAVKVSKGQWKYIVIHHSATRVGSAKGMDRYHKEERNMENGLAYHFVIGNGRGMPDGEIHVGSRWKKQLQGGHLSSLALNQVSIGICLVGDFEKSPPTPKQMEQLEALVHFLMDQTGLDESGVTTHTLIHPKHTACPGKQFPTKTFKRDLQKRRH